MKCLKWAGIGLTVLFTAVLAGAAEAREPGQIIEEIRGQATFCEGTYALCIRAPCVAIPTLDRLNNYYVEHALCSCEVVQGWSMGPGACSDRGPVKQGDRTYLISTYSNRDNNARRTLSCPDKTTWAWCYGAPCVVDENDPNKASCTCPVMQSAMNTLGGNCEKKSCSDIWSAATPAGDTFANQHYYDVMQREHRNVPVNPPAEACPVPR